jgi:hypothetical protein
MKRAHLTAAAHRRNPALIDRLSRIRQWFCFWLKDEKPRRAPTTDTGVR